MNAVVVKKVAFVPKGLERRRAKRCEQERAGTIPRVSRLMALTITIQQRIDAGEIRDYAEVARVSYLTRARVTQIMNLLALAPAIQEELLFLEPTRSGRDVVTERALRSIAANLDWSVQLREFCAARRGTESHAQHGLTTISFYHPLQPIRTTNIGATGTGAERRRSKGPQA